jgi:predicted sulfurtransferase
MKKYLLLLPLLLLALTAFAAAGERITVAEVKGWLDAGEKIVFLDSRNDYSWRTSDQIIPAAIRVHDNETFARILDTLPTSSRVVTYCT